SSVAELRAVLAAGIRLSPTFRAIVTDLERSDVVVYLTQEPHAAGAAAHTSLVASAGGRRYLRISLDPKRSGCDRLALLGHELRHALEIAVEPAVVDADSLAALYERIGFASCGGGRRCYDSAAAIEAGRQIAREVATGTSER